MEIKSQLSMLQAVSAAMTNFSPAAMASSPINEESCSGVYVADCCAVYLVDPKTPAIGLVHSGRKGTELGVVPNAIKQMIDRFGSDPANMIVQLSPCIRPPHYEVDFAAQIVRQCRALGVKEIHDPAVCTACDLDRYYSYRAEKGKPAACLR